MSDFPTPPPPMGEPEPPRRHEEPMYYDSYDVDAASRLNKPAIALMITALISALFCVYVILMNIISSPEQNIDSMRQIFQSLDVPVDEEVMQQYAGGNVIVTLVMWGFFLLVDLFLFYAAMQMRSVKNYGMAMTAAIIATIPCCWSACCVLNVPFGIWLLTILTKPEIKAAFKRYTP